MKPESNLVLSIKVTVSPVTDTVTSTEIDLLTSTVVSTVIQTSITYTVPPTSMLDKRARKQVIKRAATPTTEIPSSVPTYASACSGTSAYSSACSCLGVTTTIITRPTPTQVITISSTITPTVTVTATSLTSLVVASTVTVTTVVAQPACPNTVSPHGSCNCMYGSICNAIFVENSPGALRTVSSFTDCMLLCDNNGACGSVSYDPATGHCQQYHPIISGSSGHRRNYSGP
ncbi:hypothetical protein TWF694_005468 [Orbilia ellipsospora]|uniref:Apple domain-containing protein n=1 Tax=Orbilia ellipsospora TaxID=2528407 RepID=A0AAV9WT80_9PEZI